jgi:ferrous iron transport protein B
MKKIALIGNPNCGKTSLFNLLTGLNQKVGNYPGITVDKKTGVYKSTGGEKFTIVDLPGTYSLNPSSEDEVVVNKLLLDPDHNLYPDFAVYVCDASNIERNLLLASQVADLGIPLIFALNMSDLISDDEITKQRSRIKELFGEVDIVPVSFLKKIGISEFKQALERNVVSQSRTFFQSTQEYATYREFRIAKSVDLENTELNKIELKDIHKRFEVIGKVYHEKEKQHLSFTEKLDQILLHKIFGYLVMILIFFIMFQSVFWLASFPMDWIDSGFAWMTESMASLMPEGMVNDFITGGILAGIGGIVIFLPQIMILFGLITVLEDSGYMSRVSFLMDSLLSRVGLGGKSVVPMVSGFACAIPAVMAARNIENERKRLITIFITPFMSCSARLPVYVFLVAFLVPDETVWGIFNMQGLFMLGLYLLGLIIALLISFILQFLIANKGSSMFVLELPIYRVPRWKNAFVNMYSKGKTFVLEAGKIILAISIVLWFLTNFGPSGKMAEIDSKYEKELIQAGDDNTDLINKINAEKIQVSYAGSLGRTIEPVLKPLGFDWKIGIAVVTSFAAREVFVATISTIYGSGEEVEKISELQTRLQHEINPDTGKPILNRANAASLLIFFVFALQCMSTIAIVKRETNGWKWPMIQLAFMTGFAYFASLITYWSLV